MVAVKFPETYIHKGETSLSFSEFGIQTEQGGWKFFPPSHTTGRGMSNMAVAIPGSPESSLGDLFLLL